MRKEWFFDRFCNQQIAIYAEDGKIVDVGVENETQREIIGSIFKGKVCNVVAGMQAAFIACGLEKNCYLPLNDDLSALSSYDGKVGAEQPVSVREGEEILVQVVKSPRGGKGAKVTASLSFVGKNLIYLPQTDFLGISRKILEEQTRLSLLTEADKLRKAGEGFIVRTAATSATKRQLKTEAEYLRRVYRSVLETAKTTPVGRSIYCDLELPVKIMRDSLGSDVTKITVGDRATYEKLRNLIRLRTDISEKKLELYEGERSILRHFGLAEQIYELASPHVNIGNGANLVINRTEAMTVIDVNTGKYVGDADLESTVTHTNLLAAREIARQVRLRNLSGIIAVDFIDMVEEVHREEVRAELERCLLQDTAKCRVQPMNDLCVLLFTRKRTIKDLDSFLLKPCPHCTREGFVLSDTYMAMRIRSSILDLFAAGYRAVVVELNKDLMDVILSQRMYTAELNENWKGKRVYMIPHKTFHEEHFTVRGDNSEVLTLPNNAQILY